MYVEYMYIVFVWKCLLHRPLCSDFTLVRARIAEIFKTQYEVHVYTLCCVVHGSNGCHYLYIQNYTPKN